MSDTLLPVKDATGATKNLAVFDAGADGLISYHVEQADQRAALIAALAALDPTGGLTAIVNKLSSDPATNASVNALATLLTAIVGNTDQVETLLGAIGTALGAIDGHVTGVATQTTLAALLTAVGAQAKGTQAEPVITGSPGDVIDVVPTVITTAYSADTVFFDFTQVDNFVRENGGKAIVQSLTVIDKADQGIAFDVFTSQTAVTLGTLNAAPTITDANAASMQYVTRVQTSDYIDLGGVRIATKAGIGLLVEAASDKRTMWLGGVIRGVGTYALGDITLRVGLLWL